MVYVFKSLLMDCGDSMMVCYYEGEKQDSASRHLH
jgi:hypothetical protein